MTRIILGVLLLVVSSASAATTSIKSLLTSHPTVTSYQQLATGGPGAFMFTRQQGGRELTTGVGYQTRAGGLNDVVLYAVREYLPPAERTMLTEAAQQVALTCFNLLPERMGAFAAWIWRLNEDALVDATANFGPMTATFERDINDDGAYYTLLRLSRGGRPGQVPWINYCTP